VKRKHVVRTVLLLMATLFLFSMIMSGENGVHAEEQDYVVVLEEIRDEIHVLNRVEHELEHIDGRLKIISNVFIGILIVLTGKLLLQFFALRK